jgi:hypothetical protein
LEWTAARSVRSVRVGDLADVPKAAVLQVLAERLNEANFRLGFGFRGVAANLHPSFDESAE